MTISSGIPEGPVTMTITDSSSEAFRLVKPNTGSTVISRKGTIATANTDKVIGVLLESVTSANQKKPVQVSGVAMLRVNGNSPNIAAGDDIVAGAGGVGVHSASVNDTQQQVIGIALQPATTDDVLIEVLIGRHNLVKGTS